jgi:hypothetical protein
LAPVSPFHLQRDTMAGSRLSGILESLNWNSSLTPR